MAHLNLVMIHPFQDGNGRMARALQTMVLTQDRVVEPTFSSIEEWSGNNPREYYDVLATVGRGSWQPKNDATLWVKFNLRAHHMQAQTMRRRFQEAETQWTHIDQLISGHRLPDRLGNALFDALLGLRVTRPSYLKLTDVDERTGTRDLVAAAERGLLEAKGERRGRHYVAGPPLQTIRKQLRQARHPLNDPYPTRTTEIRRAHPQPTGHSALPTVVSGSRPALTMRAAPGIHAVAESPPIRSGLQDGAIGVHVRRPASRRGAAIRMLLPLKVRAVAAVHLVKRVSRRERVPTLNPAAASTPRPTSWTRVAAARRRRTCATPLR
jgi:hypothetical protein